MLRRLRQKRTYSTLSSPKSNAFIERFNRTLKEQFIYNNWELLGDKEELDKQLKSCINWYNNHKVHKGINFMTPNQYLTFHQKSYIY
ncbi:MAG: integrase core domain-containing protein [Elusimicrobiota bacterium]|nr:integrase core domain-containing protein [Elusimicrobiota bacterium]